MAYPIWLTPPGNLGIIPEAEYYQYTLDAYDTSGGTLKFFKLSGDLPPGLQITTSGILQGIPISTGGPDLNQKYTFTVRVQNLSTLLISDRTFNLTITNVAPPVIVPRNVNLGEYFDGTIFSMQLLADEFILGNNLDWSLQSGELPPGISLSSDGLLSGYLNLIPAVGPASDPGFSDTGWDGTYIYESGVGTLGWDFTLGTVSKTFEFTVEVSDGGLSSTSTYTLRVIPRQSTTADSDIITADMTIVNSESLTVDTGAKHYPIITSTPDSILPQRQGSWFTYHLTAIDLDGDVLKFNIPNLTAGALDEQEVLNQPEYISDSVVTNGNINVAGVFASNTISYLSSGDIIQVLAPYTDLSSSQTSLVWYDATVNDHVTLRLTGNTIITANVGDYISQAVGSANATITSTTLTTGTILLGGSSTIGTIAIAGDLIISANVGDVVTQLGSNGNAVISSTASLTALLSVVFNDGGFTLNSGNLVLNGANIASYPTSISTELLAVSVRANVGDVITQTSTGANATIINGQGSNNTNIANPRLFQVEFTDGTFATGQGSGNITVNGTNYATYPSAITAQADIGVVYNTAAEFRINQEGADGLAYIDGRNSFAQPTNFLRIGVNVNGSPNTQGNIGFDEDKFSQSALSLPGTITLNQNSGWITGFLPTLNANETVYDFEVLAYKRDFPEYQSSSLLSITVLGDLYNTVEWLTPSYLGTIQNGAVSDLSIKAISPEGKQIYYYLTPGSFANMVQGLRLQADGIITGRASFELFSLDGGTTTFDADRFTQVPTTTFDHTFEVTVTGETYDQTASSTRTFSILVRDRNPFPYENLYLKAQLSTSQKLEFRNLVQDSSVFPLNLIYRSTDPWFGIARDINTLFLPGLNASTLSEYANAIETNHFKKRLLFTDIKTAVARRDGVYDVVNVDSEEVIGTFNIYTSTFVPTDFSLGYSVRSSIPPGTRIGDQTIKYEVVYAEIKDQNSNTDGYGPPNTIDLTGQIVTPYYDASGNSYRVATPNSFENMQNIVVDNLGYLDKGVLPDWMTSIQPNGQQLGFTRAVVLAYTVPGASNTIAWRFKEKNYNLNEIDFTVDRYFIDNALSSNFDINEGTFVTSRETTFDRYPALSNIFRTIGSVDYAVSRSFQSINQRARSEINATGGIDGISNYKDGETLVFFEQEFSTGLDINDNYNQGWSNSTGPWDIDDSIKEFDEIGWDPASYVPGYNEWIASRTVVSGTSIYQTPNQRVSIWRININDSDYVSLTLANVRANITAISSNTTGYGSNLTMSSTEGIFIGMPVRGAGLNGNTVVTDINGTNISVYPAALSNDTGLVNFIPMASYNDVVYVRTGRTRGGVNIYYDPVIEEGALVPSWSKITQQIKTSGTTFDGDGTKFYDFRDTYVTPGQNDSAVRFPRLNVFI